MSAVKAFVDTNLLVYLYSDTEPDKSKKVMDALGQYECIVSTQVLNEFCHVCIRKMKIAVTDVRKALDEITAVCRLMAVGEKDIFCALRIHDKYGYSYFDSLMIASSLNSDCRYLLSEDMADGQVIDLRVMVRNIF